MDSYYIFSINSTNISQYQKFLVEKIYKEPSVFTYVV